MASVDYLNKLKELQKPTYTSQYGGVISGLMDKIVNRQPFTYDFNADPIYHQYKDQFVKGGKEAAMNAVANASALTGGYGNSYAVTAGAQANQQALSGLNDIIPQLYNAAQKKYETDLNALYADYDLYNAAEQDNYNKYRDELSDYNNERNYLAGMYQSELAQENYLAEQAEEQRRYDAQQALQLAKLNAKGSGSGGSSKGGKTDEKKANITGALLGAAQAVTGLGNKLAQSAQKPNGYADYALTQKAIQVLNGTKDINQVDAMLSAQVDRGVITEDEALQILDKVVKSR